VTEGGDLPHGKVPPHLRRNARRMRSAMTEAELKLWNELRAHRLMGLGFRRQVPIGGYIVDFACPEHKLVVEVDGSQHAENLTHDQARTVYLEQQGWQVVRFWNDDVLKDMDNVCTHILRLIGSPDDDQ
jgi:very-short-patch-repair endonuclease